MTAMKCPVPCFECGMFTMEMDMEEDHQHLYCERCERVWCTVCIGRFEVKVSEEWLRRQRVAHLN
jgi:hypothetical protein